MLIENSVNYGIKCYDKKDVTEMQLYLNLLTMMGYCFLTRIVWKEKSQTDIITVVACFIFAVQQLQLFIRFSPASSNGEK